MPRKVVVIFRFLATANLLEAAAGLWFVGAVVIFGMRRVHADLGFSEPRLVRASYVFASANLVFIALFVVSGVLLWKLRRRGLALLAWTLCLEAAYFVAVVAAGSFFRVPEATGVGNMFLGVQIATAYPLIAGVLIFLVYRCIRSSGAQWRRPGDPLTALSTEMLDSAVFPAQLTRRFVRP